jgi:6-pyruvoyltetrahydropterin/6-carboxytetrahydropterin synthase
VDCANDLSPPPGFSILRVSPFAQGGAVTPPLQYEVQVEAGFEAAHFLRQFRGGPEPLHGHSWRVEATLVSATLDEDGIAVDFGAAKQALQALADRFDTTLINDVPPFDETNPTAENVARHFLEALARRLADAPARVVAVTVHEGPHGRATVRQA